MCKVYLVCPDTIEAGSFYHCGSAHTVLYTRFNCACGVLYTMLLFPQFTFASNAATLIGGCLVDFKYKLRLPAAFISAFVISVSV